jgi:hypothetical protein
VLRQDDTAGDVSGRDGSRGVVVDAVQDDEPLCPKSRNGRRPPVGVERMLHIYFLRQWFNLSDPVVEEAFYDSW